LHGNPAATVDPAWPRYTGVDLSSAARKGNVIFTIALKPTGARIPIDIRRGNWSSPDTAGQVIDVFRTHHSRIILVENNAYQSALLEWIGQLPGAPKDLPVIGYTTGRQKWQEGVGLGSLEVEFSRGAWEIYAPEHQPACQCAWCVWVGEMKLHPLASTTDCVMACWFSREAIRYDRPKGPLIGKAAAL